jgi:hypothetical protein
MAGSVRIANGQGFCEGEVDDLVHPLILTEVFFLNGSALFGMGLLAFPVGDFGLFLGSLFGCYCTGFSDLVSVALHETGLPQTVGKRGCVLRHLASHIDGGLKLGESRENRVEP